MQKINEPIDELLFKYFANELTESEEKELLAWLASDLSHKTTLYQMADWWAVAHVPLFSSDLKSGFRKHFKNLANQTQRNQTKPSFRIKHWYKIAASVLLLSGIGISFFYLGKSSQQPPQTAFYEIAVPLGSQSKVTLPDQSIVWLNAGSSLTYYEDHTAGTRNVSMNGEGYFEVAANPGKPFTVTSEVLQLVVLGTSFNLKAYENDATIDLVLVSGKVGVNINHDKTETYQLLPDNMLSYHKENNNLEIQPVSGSDYGNWKDRVLKFDRQIFTQLAKDLERIYNVSIEIESDQLKKEYFSGSFSYDYTLNDILTEVDIDKKYKWEHNKNKLIIRDK
jgi:ferric-dicitrate binding protein FerR (iron transport regulator)